MNTLTDGGTSMVKEDRFTNARGITRTKAGITYCNTHNLEIAAIGFGWCYDDTYKYLEINH
ncbi:MAG: hypothetical protein U5L72_06805 [Bacteroidales bacterium]|nr:hypothetical protein [Bacteroidales bacterium]